MSTEGTKRELAWVVEGIDYLQDTPGEIADRVLASEWLKTQKADVWDEARKARAQYLGPNNGHYEDCAGWEDCDCASYPNPYRAEETP